MKKILLAFATCSSFMSFAQTPITLDRSDFPCPSSTQCGADSVLFSSVPIANNPIDISLTGASSIWNYGSLVPNGTNFQRFVPPNTTPAIFQLLFIGSDFANPLLGNLAIAGLPISDAYEYYNYATANSRLEIRGYAANITIPGQTTAIPLPAIYSSADVIYRFPVAYGNIDSSTSGYSVTIPPTGTAIATIKRNQKRVNEVDAWGSLTTPAGTFDVLRVKSTINRIDSVLIGFPLGIPTNTIEYKWIAKGKKIPALQVNASVVGGNPTITSINYWGTYPLGQSSINANIPYLLLKPNPASQVTTLEFLPKTSGNAQVEIISINGQRVGHFEFKVNENQKVREILPIQGLSEGNYIIQMNLAGEKAFQKLTIQ